MGKSSIKRMTEQCNTPTQDLIDKTGLKDPFDLKCCDVCGFNVLIENFSNKKATTCNRCKKEVKIKKPVRKKRVKQ